MGSMFLMGIVFLIAIAVMFVRFPAEIAGIKRALTTSLFIIGGVIGGFGAVGYNSAGYCTHIQTIFGTEDAKCTTGWYFSGWGFTTEYPHYITVAHSNAADAQGTSVNAPYSVRLADNWNGTVTQTTRFEIPRDREQFLKLHSTFRGAESLTNRTLRPAVLASLDSVSNLFSMEEYYAGGKRDQFKTEYRDAISQGRARVRQVTAARVGGGVVEGNAAPNDLEFTQDDTVQDNLNTRRVVMEKVTDTAGNVIREPHDFMQYGIVVSQAILENLDPDDRFEQQIQARKDAASRRIVAQEERREQEEQRLLAIQRGETQIAQRQAEARVEQIQRTTEAETEKQLALIAAQRQREEADIARATAEINLERARIDAEAVQVTADAEAYQKEVILEADGALAQKLEAWVEAQRVWADAASRINVPATVIAGGGESAGTAGNALGTVDSFMQMLMVKTARDLQVDPTIRPAQ